MKKLKIFLVLLVLFISISAVSAEGNFTALQSEIDSSTDTIEITQDYVYDNATDYELKSGVTINKSDFTINGNGYTIDGNNQVRMFLINGTNITINNLNLINGKSVSGGAIGISPNCSLTTNNVTFENNNVSKNGGAVLNYGFYTSMNDKFINNNGAKGGSIVGSGSELEIINGTFMSDSNLNWGLIYLSNSLIYIENTTFANTSANYSTAIYAESSRGKIKKSDFVNLTAKMTAGAIGIKSLTGEIEIEDCNFINTRSGKNGGAIYADIAGEGEGNGNITVVNSQFINCSSEFGGAYLQLAGRLTIDNTNFTSNTALFDGGAIYTSWADNVNISNSVFDSNSGIYDGLSNGGSCYFDMGNITLDSCILENNNASEGSSIYAYDCGLSLLDNYFNNPTASGVSIYTVYSKIYYESENNFTNDEISLNNTNYNINMESSQTKFDLINNTISVTTLPKRFDLRDWGWVSPVLNQGSMCSCWAFGITGALESA